jgi:hypothetical protein
MSLPTFLPRDRSDTPSDSMDHRRLAYYPPAIPGAGVKRRRQAFMSPCRKHPGERFAMNKEVFYLE